MSQGTVRSYFGASNGRRESGATEKFSFRVSPEMAVELAAVGKAEGLGSSDTVRLVLERGLEATRKHPKRKVKT